MPIYIGVVGPGDASGQELADAEHVGARLAEQGWYVVCGGLGGVMASVCRGAAGAGGVTIGLLPGLDRAEGNANLTVSIPTGLGELRNGLVVRASDALVAIGGGWGTLSEIALALRAGKPVLGLRTWAVQAPHPTRPAGFTEVAHRDGLVPALLAALPVPPG
ncbi:MULTISPECIES: TIGR00725 family protein [unclassified Pseudofrankia]|uniref:TIGR00725 family protein n=1 Tax=unclassified Pseudofrankia TaxID=2994372 RepID=UPI0008DB2F81|nr:MULTISPECIES: TIGR00725 family protein [unclassified Pseudofrankia]MDT3445721.1 TIGR00725 family protein [Pseudofrankia sp. BMG5.37]OHV42472.1 TIGR00725 family protein [Pseudofrankia sp. BMG5.36]